MSIHTNSPDVRAIPRDSSEFEIAVHLALGLPQPGNESATLIPVQELLAEVDHGGASIDLLFGAYRSDRLVSCCMAVELPGSTALVLIWAPKAPDASRGATVALLRQVQKAAWKRRIALLEILQDPGRDVLGQALSESGFRYLTRLRYLRRRVSERPATMEIARDLTWITYTPEQDELFQKAVQRSYVDSMDCPELSETRSLADVLSGHRATGVFDPRLWWVACRRGEPVGVMLLNRLKDRAAAEIVYMGVAQVARGTGVANALLERTIDIAARKNVNNLALAVDERNRPARSMYNRWGFVETVARDAWIATPHTP